MTLIQKLFLSLCRGIALLLLAYILIGFVFRQWNPIAYNEVGRMFMVQFFLEILCVYYLIKYTAWRR